MTLRDVGKADRQRARWRQRALSFFAVLCGIGSAAGWPFAAAAESCATTRVDERVVVAHVHDGDTVTLQDGRKLRLVGIDTPELGRDGQPDQPYAIAARDALDALLTGRRELELRFDNTRKDHYGRLLAHAFLPDGSSIEQRLLEGGYATQLLIPPNDWNYRCYQAAEKQARQHKTGIWSLAAYQPVRAADLASTAQGYHVIRGRVERVGESARSVWLNLEGGVEVRIDRNDVPNFSATPLRTLWKKEVIVRGMVHPARDGRHRLMLRLWHPVDLDVLG